MLIKFSPILLCLILLCDEHTCRHAISRHGNHLNIYRSKDRIIPENTRRHGPKVRGLKLTEDEVRKLNLWPQGVIPYFIDDVSYSDKVLRDKIRLVLNTVNSVTGVSFMEMATIPQKDDKMRWVFFVNRAGQMGCDDHDSRKNKPEGVQEVRLGYDCMSMGNEIAEAVLAIVGVPPQHNSPDRDEFIEIHTENIIPEKQHLFEKVKEDEWLFKDMKYDFSSAGHFHNHRHSVNGRATISIIQDKNSGIYIGEKQGFSSQDVQKIKMLYNFISKKNEVPECSKLFNTNVVPNDQADYKEHKTSEGSIEESVESSANNPQIKNLIGYQMPKKVYKTTEDLDNINNDMTSKVRLHLKNKHIMKKVNGKGVDPLSELSDFHSGDRSYERKVLKQT